MDVCACKVDVFVMYTSVFCEYVFCVCGSYMSNEHTQLERVLRGSCSTHNIG